MGKSSGKTPTNQTSTQTSIPYLTSHVTDAANAARNLYQGNRTVSSTTTTAAPTTSGSMFVGPDGRVYSGDQNSIISSYMQNNPSPLNQNMATNPSLGMMKNGLEASGFKPLSGGATGGTTTTEGGVETTPEGWPDYFPGQTYVDYSPETLQALGMISDRATNGSALTGAANTAVLDTINGKYLDSNPYLNNVIDTSLNDVTKRYTDQVLPGLASNFAQSGRYGSGIQQNLTSDAVGQLGKEAMGVASGIRYDNYNQERGRQLNAASIAPTLAQADYFDAQQLMGVGSAREALSQAKLQDEMDRFNYYENQPANMLDQYINRIGALNSGSGTTTMTGPTAQRPGGSPMAGALSGGMAGLGIGSMMAPAGATGMAALGGPWGLGLAAGGALLGGLFS